MLTKSQRERVEYFLSDDWVDLGDDREVTSRNLAAVLAAVESPLELHLMVAGFNWDTGADAVEVILA
ncbi:MAG: hypothetical protein KC420_21415 [Myxococcales bacterium]|nr:hypothetical protein [Myxococcales bacterium]MCA9638609.1 hypothetical protein [Myxococcales bacterium]